MASCERCGSEKFYEEDGFQFCAFCNTQSQGFAREEQDEETIGFNVQSVAVKVGKKSKRKEKVKKAKEKEEEINLESNWSTFEAFNEIFLGILKDFFEILEKLNLELSSDLRKRFYSVSMQIWFKYLRECEIVFTKEELDQQKLINLTPAARYRDFILLSNPNQTEEKIEIPHYIHSKKFAPKIPNNKFGYGKKYRGSTSKKPNIENPLYHNEDIYSILQKDPRLFLLTDLKDCCKKVKRETVSEFLTDFKKNEDNDSFVEFIKNLKDNGNFDFDNLLPSNDNSQSINNNEALETTSTNADINNDDNGGNDGDNEFKDELEFKNLLKKRMPKKLRLLVDLWPHCGLKKFRQSSSFLGVTNVGRTIMISLLYIIIRLFNFNIYLGDLIRWCVDDNLKLFNLFQHFKKDRQLMWIDRLTFVDHTWPSYDAVNRKISDIFVFLQFNIDLFPKPDLYHLIERYLNDLNLPKGTIIIIKKRLDSYLQNVFNNRTLFKKFPSCDIYAMISIILTLRDLFDLNGTTEHNYRIFKNCPEKDLFIWSDWLRYSLVRFNLIKAFFLNISPSHCDVVNLDEVLSRNYSMYKYFKDHELRSRKTGQHKVSQHKFRFKLQDLFEQTYFDDENFEWKEKYQESSTLPSLYPLTSFTETICSKVENSDIKNLLTQEFRNLLITPYMCPDNYFFHRRNHLDANYSKNGNFEHFEFSDSFYHLLELGACIINCKVTNLMEEIFRIDKSFKCE